MPGKDDTDKMRDRADWMVPADDQILEFLCDNPAGTPKKIAERLDRHNHYIGERCRTLASYGLVDRVGRGVYTLSADGEMYLNEELDASTLELDEE